MKNSRGIYSSIEDLLSLRFAARQLALGKSRRARASMSGGHASKIRGRGIDFDEVRKYQAGDDIRSMDWRVTARTSVPHIKLYHEEKERPVFILCDQSSSLFFGSGERFKSCLSAEIAALLSWMTIEQGDKLGGMIFNDKGHTEIKPKRGKKSVLRYLNTLAEYNALLSTSPLDQDYSLSDAIMQSNRIIKPGSLVYIISDFYSFNDVCMESLSLLHRHNDISCIYVHDELEESLPPSNIYSFRNNSGSRFRIHTGNRKLRDEYAESFRNHRKSLENNLNKLKISLLDARTDSDPATIISSVVSR